MVNNYDIPQRHCPLLFRKIYKKMTDGLSIIDPLKDERWDNFVKQHPFGWLCHLSGWKQVLESSFKHIKGHYLVLLNGCEIKAALPLFEVRSWLTGNRLVSIPFATLCDPLISTTEDMTKLFQGAVNLSKQLGISSIEIKTLSSYPLIQDNQLCVSNFFKHHYLVLDGSLDQIKNNFHRTCVRQRIARASNSNMKVKEVDNEADFHNFYTLYLLTRKRIGLPPQPYIFLKELWKVFSPQKMITVLIVEQKDRPIAGMMLFKFKNRISAEFSVLDETYQHMSPNHLLFWEAIQLAYHEGYKIFDFGRTSPNNETLMDFKRRWGTTIVDLPQFYYPKQVCYNKNGQEQSIKHKLIQTILKNAPQPILNRIGKVLYGHMG